MKKLLLLLMGLPFLLLGRLYRFLTKLMLAYALKNEKSRVGVSCRPGVSYFFLLRGCLT